MLYQNGKYREGQCALHGGARLQSEHSECRGRWVSVCLRPPCPTEQFQDKVGLYGENLFLKKERSGLERRLSG